MICHWDKCPGKVWRSNDSESGELPVEQSPFLPARDGEGIIGVVYAIGLRQCVFLLKRAFSMGFSYSQHLLFRVEVDDRRDPFFICSLWLRLYVCNQNDISESR